MSTMALNTPHLMHTKGPKILHQISGTKRMMHRQRLLTVAKVQSIQPSIQPVGWHMVLLTKRQKWHIMSGMEQKIRPFTWLMVHEVLHQTWQKELSMWRVISMMALNMRPQMSLRERKMLLPPELKKPNKHGKVITKCTLVGENTLDGIEDRHFQSFQSGSNVWSFDLKSLKMERQNNLK